MCKKKFILGSVLLFALALWNSCVSQPDRSALSRDGGASGELNGTIYQYFHWYSAGGGTLWETVKADAPELARKGVTAVWLPPAYKGDTGKNSVGYDVYDLYDLGEFDQKGSIATKYGTKDQYLAAIQALHANNIQVYADIVLNHKIGADSTERVNARTVDNSNRNKVISNVQAIDVWTSFTFPGRNNRYSPFVWDHTHFDGADWAQNLEKKAIFLFDGKTWDWPVDGENGNYDYLIGSDVDFQNPVVAEEYRSWGSWYLDFAKIDGVRVDAVKHVEFTWFRDWLAALRSKKPDLFAVGEYLSYDVQKLHQFISASQGSMALFDFPLHLNFYQASQASGHYDMRKIFDNTLTQQQPALSVSFVDNHDTQPLQGIESPVQGWFKQIAYSLILTRQEGYPTVFWPDEHGASYYDAEKKLSGNIEAVRDLEKIMRVRKLFAYGPQKDYFDHQDIIGWTRRGAIPLAAIASDGPGGSKWMEVGLDFKGKKFCDYMGYLAAPAVINQDGWGEFKVNGGSIALWVPCEHMPQA